MKRIHLLTFILIHLAIFSPLYSQITYADIGSSTIMNASIDDSGIISKAQTAIDTNPALTGEKITVTSYQGIVTLEGEVSEQSQISTAIDSVKDIPGVLNVRSDLTVKIP
jgi:osmotically-inducible protein OsmY